MNIYLSQILEFILFLFIREEKVKTIVDDIMDKIPEQFNMADIMAKVEERTPYVIVAFQVIILKVCVELEP